LSERTDRFISPICVAGKGYEPARIRTGASRLYVVPERVLHRVVTNRWRRSDRRRTYSLFVPQQNLMALVLGYQRAVARFMTGGDRPRPLIVRAVRHMRHPASETSPLDDQVPISAYAASLSEALNWAYSVDDRMKRDWRDDWYTEAPHAAHMRGIRYARNCVQHDCAEAVDLDERRAISGHPRALSVAWRWVPNLIAERPDPVARAAYDRCLAGEPVLPTLTGLVVGFLEAALEMGKLGLLDIDARPDAPAGIVP